MRWGQQLGSGPPRTSASGNEEPRNCQLTQQPVLQSLSAISTSATTCLKLKAQFFVALHVSGGEKTRLIRPRLDYQPLFGKMSPHSSQRPDPGDGGNRA